MTAAGRREAGLTVVEVVLAAVLTSIVVAASVGVVTGALRAARYATVRTSTGADVRIAMEQVTRELRVAMPLGVGATTPALIAATPSSLSFYSAIKRTGTEVFPYRVDYAYDGTCLRGTRTPTLDAAGTLDVAHAQTGCVLRTTTAPAFTYYASGAISLNGVTSPALNASSGLSAADRAATLSVEVTLTGQSVTSTDIAGSQLRSRVTLTNVVLAGS